MCSTQPQSSLSARAAPAPDTATPVPPAAPLLKPAESAARFPSRASAPTQAFSESAGPAFPATDQSGFPSLLLWVLENTSCRDSTVLDASYCRMSTGECYFWSALILEKPPLPRCRQAGTEVWVLLVP